MWHVDYLLERFLKEFPTFPNSFLVGGPADFFVIELTDQVTSLVIAVVTMAELSFDRFCLKYDVYRLIYISSSASEVKSWAGTSTLPLSHERSSRSDYSEQVLNALLSACKL